MWYNKGKIVREEKLEVTPTMAQMYRQIIELADKVIGEHLTIERLDESSQVETIIFSKDDLLSREEVSDISDCIEVRGGGKFADKAIFLPVDYDYHLIWDREAAAPILVPTKKRS